MVFNTLDRTLAPVFRLTEYLVVLLGVALVGLVFLQVLLRYFTDISFYGSEELTRFILIWFVFLSAAVGLERGGHFAMDAVTSKLPPLARQAAAILAHLIVLAVLYVFLTGGWAMTVRNWRQLSSAMQIPMSFANAAVPLSALLMIAVVIRDLFRPPGQREVVHAD